MGNGKTLSRPDFERTGSSGRSTKAFKSYLVQTQNISHEKDTSKIRGSRQRETQDLHNAGEETLWVYIWDDELNKLRLKYVGYRNTSLPVLPLDFLPSSISVKKGFNCELLTCMDEPVGSCPWSQIWTEYIRHAQLYLNFPSGQTRYYSQKYTCCHKVFS